MLQDSWAAEQPEVLADRDRREADRTAWHAFNQMERAIGAVRQAMEDPALGPEWRDQLRSISLRAGALAIAQEVC